MNKNGLLRTVVLVLVIMVASACQNAPNELATSTATPRPIAPTPLPTETGIAPTAEATTDAAPTVVSDGTPSGVVIVYPSADTFVDSEQPDANFGAADELYASAGRAD